MVNRIELPKMPEGNAEEQMRSMYSYLYQMAQALNNNLAEIGGAELTDGEQAEMKEALEASAAGEAGAPQEAETLKSLIIKTAKYVKTAIDRYNMKLTGSSTAEGKIGKYVRNTEMSVDVTPEGTQQSFSFQEIIQGLKTYEINAKNYIKTGLLRTVDGIPVYGVAIGKDVVTFAEDGTETYHDGNKVAELTAEELSFWQNGTKMASYALSGIEFEQDLTLKSGKKLIIDTENFKINSAGQVTVKGGGEFSGELKAASGTFTGKLQAATGTFEGTLSAACITSGTMRANRISGGTLTLGGNNNANGTLIIKDANGAQIGKWDKDGITATKGTFSGNLQAAGGTFSGNLQAAGGTFSGNLQAAGGTFSGDLNAAGGTFTGEVQAGDWTFNNNGIDLHNVDGNVGQHMNFRMVKNGNLLKEGQIRLSYDNLGDSASYSFGFHDFYGGVNTGIAGERPGLGTSVEPWGDGYINHVITNEVTAGDWTINNNGIDMHNANGTGAQAVSQHLKFRMKKNGSIMEAGEISLLNDTFGDGASYSFGFSGFYGDVNTGVAGGKPDLGTSGNPWGNGYIDNVVTSSSRSMKHGIRKLEADGKRIDRLKPVSFIYNDDPKETRRMGLILEDTQEVMPEICEETGIRYTELIPVLIREIQELRARVSALEAAKGEK